VRSQIWSLPIQYKFIHNFQLQISSQNPGLLALAHHLSLPFKLAKEGKESTISTLPNAKPQSIAKNICNTHSPSLLSLDPVESALIHDFMSGERTFDEFNAHLASRTYLVGNGFCASLTVRNYIGRYIRLGRGSVS
jgi:hypothetical protein